VAAVGGLAREHLGHEGAVADPVVDRARALAREPDLDEAAAEVHDARRDTAVEDGDAYALAVQVGGPGRRRAARSREEGDEGGVRIGAGRLDGRVDDDVGDAGREPEAAEPRSLDLAADGVDQR
jgi:hypothetical protein